MPSLWVLQKFIAENEWKEDKRLFEWMLEEYYKLLDAGVFGSPEFWEAASSTFFKNFLTHIYLLCRFLQLFLLFRVEKGPERRERAGGRSFAAVLLLLG
jgi:hypothetical protein